jgi:hypothetical protein
VARGEENAKDGIKPYPNPLLEKRKDDLTPSLILQKIKMQNGKLFFD